jgi:hypothetical protein
VTAGLLGIAEPTGALAQKMPTIDPDGQLSAASVGQGRLHAVIDFNLQNGDFSRGKYDDDAANLDRLPFAVGVTLGWQLHKNAEGQARPLARGRIVERLPFADRDRARFAPRVV